MEWSLYTNPENDEETAIYFEDITKEEYDTKYKNHLTCINGCEARVKFTQKKNNKKFFSTWNKEGDKHIEGHCQFHVDYCGTIGRNKLKGIYEKREINDSDIKITLLNKIRGLKRKYNGEDEKKPHVNTNLIENTGEKSVPVDNVELVSSSDFQHKERRENNIMSIDAQYLSTSYVGTRKCVYGIGSNAQIGSENGQYYGYINLKNKGYTVAVYFPESFYSQENGISLDDFKRLIDILKTEININHKKSMIVCYGEIGRKNKTGVNINIISETHIYINEMSIRQILSKGTLQEIDYDIV